MTGLVHVAAAAIFNAAGEVLLARRSADQHQGGLWEFPGGKVEPGEPVLEALARELHEELGIDIDWQATRPLIKVPYHYPDKSVLLDVFKVAGFRGEPYGREGQPLRWVNPKQLAGYAFPAANGPIVNAVMLPTTIAILGPQTPADPRSAGGISAGYLRAAERALARGAQWLMLRDKQLDASQRIALAVHLQQHLAGVVVEGTDRRVGLILNGSVDEGNAAQIDALHLTSARLMALTERAEFNGRWLGASCHSAAQLQRAVDLQLDYVTLSPVQATTSHPDEPVLGWDAFACLAEQYPIPVYALGGVGLAALERCWRSGGQGIAAISAFA